MLTKILRELASKQNLRVVRSNGKIKALVGYQKPPAEHQFKPGNSGGPGRPKGNRSLIPFIRRELFNNDGEKAKKLAENIVARATLWSDPAARIVIGCTTPNRRSR